MTDDKIEELLKVLDLPEEEQRKIIGSFVTKQHSHFVKQLNWTGSDWTVTPCHYCGKEYANYTERQKDKSPCTGQFPYKGSLADLAFRLRDEVSLGQWPALAKAYECVRNKWCNDTWTQRHEQGFNKKHISSSLFWLFHSRPIHWIVASLIAQELVKGE